MRGWGLLLGVALAAPHAAPPAGEVQLLDRDAAGHPTLARVALAHALPGILEANAGLGGTWSYLVADGPRVMVVDSAPRYALAWSLLPWGDAKRWLQPLPNTRRQLDALNALFPGRPVSMIVLTHWHPDHTEAAPELQQALARRFGSRPPLRIRGVDRPAHGNGILAGGAEAVFRAAGFHDGDWTWGPDLGEGERLGRTGFDVLPLPGHTRGTIALVDPARRISLGPTPRYQQGTLLTEQPVRFRSSMLTYYEATYGFRHYASHPVPEVVEDWPAPPWTRPHKQPASPAR